MLGEALTLLLLRPSLLLAAPGGGLLALAAILGELLAQLALINDCWFPALDDLPDESQLSANFLVIKHDVIDELEQRDLEVPLEVLLPFQLGADR